VPARGHAGFEAGRGALEAGVVARASAADRAGSDAGRGEPEAGVVARASAAGAAEFAGAGGSADAAGAAGEASSVGGSSGSAGRAGTSGAMAGSNSTCDLGGFGEALRAAREPRGTALTCASSLPAMQVGDAAEARAAIGKFIGDVLGAAPASFMTADVECGTGMNASCARHFQHDIYKSNGVLGESLFPLAEHLETCANLVQETIWRSTVNGVTGQPAVCLAGIWNRQLVGIVFFNGIDACP
jgi:hypothetical protein